MTGAESHKVLYVVFRTGRQAVLEITLGVT